MHLVLGHNLNIFLTNFLMGRVMGQLVFVSGQKNRVRVMFFLGRVRNF